MANEHPKRSSILLVIKEIKIKTTKRYHFIPLTYMQSTSCEMQGWMKHKLESILPGEISGTSYMYHPYDRKQRRTKEPLDESERGE